MDSNLQAMFVPGMLAYTGVCMLIALLSAAVAYFLGCFNGAVIVSKYIFRDDVRTHGSGNAGLTNFYRTFGGVWTFVVILCDALKAFFAVLIGAWAFRFLDGMMVFLALETNAAMLGKLWAGLFCMLGHMFPCMFHFKGGKGVLCGGTVAIMVDWRVALVVWGGFLLLVVLTRYVSLGSVYAGTAFPFATWFILQDWMLAILAAACGGLLVWGHRGNIQRLRSGTESKFSFHHKSKGA